MINPYDANKQVTDHLIFEVVNKSDELNLQLIELNQHLDFQNNPNFNDLILNGFNIFSFSFQPLLYSLYESIKNNVLSLEIKRFSGRLNFFEFYNNSNNQIAFLTTKFYLGNSEGQTEANSKVTVSYLGGSSVELCGTRVPSFPNEGTPLYMHNRNYEYSLYSKIIDASPVNSPNFLSIVYFKITFKP